MQKLKSLLIFVPHLRYGGVSTVLLNLLSGLVKTHYKIHVVIGVADDDLLIKLEKINGLKVTNLKVSRSRMTLKSIILILKNNNYDVAMGVQAHGVWIVVLAALFAFYKGKIVSWEHTTPSKTMAYVGFKGALFLRFIRLLYKRVNKIFAVSEGVSNDVHKAYAVRQQDIKVLPSPIYEQRRERNKRNKNDSKQLLFIGRLSPEKGVMDILQALTLVTVANWSLTIVGSGEEEHKLKDYVNNTPKINQKVVFAGYYQDASSWYMNSDILILASYYEGLPTVLVEASSFGLPLISTDCESGPNEIITPHKNGLLVPVGHYHLLADAINDMILNYDTFENSESFVECYRYDIAVANFVKYFDELLDV